MQLGKLLLLIWISKKLFEVVRRNPQCRLKARAWRNATCFWALNFREISSSCLCFAIIMEFSVKPSAPIKILSTRFFHEENASAGTIFTFHLRIFIPGPDSISQIFSYRIRLSVSASRPTFISSFLVTQSYFYEDILQSKAHNPQRDFAEMIRTLWEILRLTFLGRQLKDIVLIERLDIC